LATATQQLLLHYSTSDIRALTDNRGSAVRSHAATPDGVTTTAANVADVTQARQLLHGEESFAYGDAGYTGVATRPENQHRELRWEIAARPGTIRAMPEGKLKAGAKRWNTARHASAPRSSILSG